MSVIENILIKNIANFESMKNGEMITQVQGDKVFSYLKYNNSIYTLPWKKQAELINESNEDILKSKNFEQQKLGWRIKSDGESEFEKINSRVSINSLNWKFFEGTSASGGYKVEHEHEIPNGKKRIVVVSVNIQSDSSPSLTGGSIPVDSFIAGAGNIQDESDDDWDFKTFYDDDKIYIVSDSSGTDIQQNQYVCSVFYTDRDLY